MKAYFDGVCSLLLLALADKALKGWRYIAEITLFFKPRMSSTFSSSVLSNLITAYYLFNL